jgi:uncharacterized protein YjiS (DUF1127 family)
MERIMSMILSAPVAARAAADPSAAQGLTATLRRWWVAYVTWRIERLAVSRLATLSDRELGDIAIVRSQIEFAMTSRLSRRRMPVGHA